MALEYSFRLPYPPTANNLFRTLTKGPLAGRRVLTGDAKDYRKLVGRQLMLQRVPLRSLSGKLAVAIVVHPPDRRARDLDNVCKTLLDSLKAAEFILDDSDIDDLHLLRGTMHKPGYVSVHVAEIVGGATISKSLDLPQPPPVEETSIVAAKPF